MPLPNQLRHLSLPVICSPMFIASGLDLVIAQCKAGVVGSFPALNARPKEELDRWIDRIETELAAYKAANPAAIQPASDPVVRNSLLGARIKGVRFTLNGATADPYGGAVSAATPGRVVFDARGLPSTSGAFFLASDDGKVARAVSVTGAGRVRVWSRIGSTWQ